MEKIKNLIQEVKKTLGTVQVFLHRHKWVLPAILIPIVVIPIAVETYGTLWGPHVVVYKYNWELQNLLDREAQRNGIEGVIRGGIDGKLQGMLIRGRRRQAIADAYRQGAIAPPPSK
jgi:hypothetical protein